MDNRAKTIKQASQATIRKKLSEVKQSDPAKDFLQFITSDRFIDNSEYIKHIIDKNNVMVKILPFPQKSGKTINLLTLQYFFSASVDGKETKNLFSKLSISQSPDYMAYQGRYPVIFLSFADFDARKLGFKKAFSKKMSEVYQQHIYVKAVLDEYDLKRFDAILNADEELNYSLENALSNLFKYVSRYHRNELKKENHDHPILLMDDYDVLCDYADSDHFLVQHFLSNSFKNNMLHHGIAAGLEGGIGVSPFPNNCSVYRTEGRLYEAHIAYQQQEQKASHVVETPTVVQVVPDAESECEDELSEEITISEMLESDFGKSCVRNLRR